MYRNYLKTIRQIVSLIVLICISALFLDLHGVLPGYYFKSVLYFQFLPSILSFILAAGVTATGFICVLILTGAVGRVYCSFLCPLGISFDLVSRISKKFFIPKKRYSKPHNILRHGLLVLAIVTVVSGSMSVINLLDPYSNFGRIIVVCIKPVAAVLNNSLAAVLEAVNVYSVAPYVQAGIDLPVILFVVVFVAAVIWLAVKHRRLYCNTLCPVGAILGIMSKWSILILSIDLKTCTGCGKCERQCKSGCIDFKEMHIDTTRCVSCFNCLEACPEDSISFKHQWRRNPGAETTSVNTERRTLIIATVLFLSGIGKLAYAVSKPVVYVKNKFPVKRNSPVTPPGSVSISHFTGHCTACYLCVTACPGNVIQPVLAGYGNRGVLMPGMVNKHGYCDFRCTRCGDICPTGAIRSIDMETKQQVQIGKVVFIRENCIVITQKTDCGACSEHCPTKAVFMVVENNLRVPKVNPDICIGCGACEYACPSIPHKSIYVDGNPVHLKADRPKIKKLKHFDTDEEFPF